MSKNNLNTTGALPREFHAFMKRQICKLIHIHIPFYTGKKVRNPITKKLQIEIISVCKEGCSPTKEELKKKYYGKRRISKKS